MLMARTKKSFKGKITMIPGDGIGPEISEAMMAVIDAEDAGLRWEVEPAGIDVLEETGKLVPDDVHKSIKRNRIAIKGPLTTPVGGGHRSINVQLRQEYKLFANVRPIKLIPGVRSRYVGEAMDMVLFRENTEDLYAGIEHTIVPGVVETLKIITSKASTRIARMAFEYAESRGRKKVTVVHKANIMKLSDGLFLECARKESLKHPNIEFEAMIVDNCCMQIVLNPSQFDVILLPNLYGDIISDLCAGLVGGLGVTPGANIGHNTAIFESVHGSAPDIAGQGLANPTALILSATMMLRHLGLHESAFRVRQAITNVIQKGQTLTKDLGGDATTKEFEKAIVGEIKRLKKRGLSALTQVMPEQYKAKHGIGGAGKKSAKKKTAQKKKTANKKTTKKKATKKSSKK